MDASPLEIETVLSRHSLVLDCIVWGRDLPNGTAVVSAGIVLKEEHKFDLNEDKLIVSIKKWNGVHVVCRKVKTLFIFPEFFSRTSEICEFQAARVQPHSRGHQLSSKASTQQTRQTDEKELQGCNDQEFKSKWKIYKYLNFCELYYVQSSFDITIRDITISLDIMILFSREIEFLLNKNSRFNDIFDIFCRVTEDIVISKLDLLNNNKKYNYKVE